MKYINRRRSMLITLGIILFGLVVGGYAVVHQAKFGQAPEGARLERIQASPNYADGIFINTTPTPTLMEGESSLKIMWKGLWADKARLRPQGKLPVVKVDLNALDKAQDTVIWLGHSSCFMQLGGKRILVDPVFSAYGAPFSFLNTSFSGTDIYTAADMPDMDLLLITHDHWDHLDYQSVVDLLPKVKKIIVPLGVGAHLERFGVPQEQFVEADWNTALAVDLLMTVHVTPARHYSGRTLVRNKTLWAGFVLETPERRVFVSGDSGFGPHFAEIARRFGGFDLVMLDAGQYDPRWPLIHMTPEEAAQAAEILNATALLPGHVGRFAIAAHTWDAPFIRMVKASAGKPFRLLTPKIGEPVRIGDAEQHFSHWWEGMQ